MLTISLIVANVLVFAYTVALKSGVTTGGGAHAGDGLGPLLAFGAWMTFVDQYAINPLSIRWWNFITHAFLHLDGWHIAGNMLFLWVFGPNLEDRLGRIGFALLYIAGAVGAAAAHCLFEGTPAIGASGAVAALTGAYLVLFPRTVVRCVSLFFIFGVVLVPAWWFIALAVVIDLLVTALDKSGIGTAARVATLAHLGGYTVGATTAAVLLVTGLLPREEYDLVAAARHWNRRRTIRAAVRASEAASRKTGAFREPTRTADGAQTNGTGTSEGGEVAALRARVSAAVSAERMDEAAALYAQLVALRGPESSDAARGPAVVVLPRRHQIDLANHLLATGRHDLATRAYEGFASVHREDSEAPRARLMASLLAARYLSKPDHARSLLAGLRAKLPDPEHDALAAALERELGMQPSDAAPKPPTP